MAGCNHLSGMTLLLERSHSKTCSMLDTAWQGKFCKQERIPWSPGGKLLNMQSQGHSSWLESPSSHHLQFYSSPPQRALTGWIIPAGPRAPQMVSQLERCSRQRPCFEGPTFRQQERKRENTRLKSAQTHSAGPKPPAVGFIQGLKHFSGTLCHRSVGTNKR